ncbi:MAG: DinB family protein [Chloroflexi bacterium]|nr:DinB family protein [Chloroflexota bacterium]
MSQDNAFTRVKFEQYLTNMAVQREEMLALIRPLSSSMRNWKPNNEQMNIHELLMHIGSSECWYVSKLDKLISAPTEVTLMRYLHQSREIVLHRLNQFTEAQLTQEYDDGWDIVRVLDHILDHEREHIGQITDILVHWRLDLNARLAAERAYLFHVLLGLSEAHLTTGEPMPGWTVKDLLAHIAFWDGFHTGRMQMVVDGRIREISEIGDDSDLDTFNTKLLIDHKEIPLEQAVAMLHKERSGFLQLLKQISDAELQSQIRLPWGWRTHLRVWAKWRYLHDMDHAQQIEIWRKNLPQEKPRTNGPTFLLRALLKACHIEFVSLLPLLPQSEWDSRPVCGVWTMKDLIGHLTAWAEVGGMALAQLLDGQTPAIDPISDFEAWNQAEATKRSDLPWETVREAYEASHQALVSGLDALSEEQLALEFTAPWGASTNLYRWLTIWPLHEREHAIDVRHSLSLSRWPKRLTASPE